MPVEIKRIDPLEMRTAIVNFFWKLRMWPYPTIDHYFRFWDWRHRCLSEGDPVAWVALNGTEIVGHITLLFRTLTCNGRRVRAGVTANFRVEADSPRAPLSAALASAPRRLVRDGEIDIMLGFSNPAAHRMAVALGSREVGPMSTLADVVQWTPILRRRLWALGALAPLLSTVMRARRFLGGARSPGHLDAFAARTVGAEELATLDHSHWEPSPGLTWNGSLTAFANRHCPSEFRASQVRAIIDRQTSRLEGLVALEGANDLQIRDCAFNARALSAPQAVALAARSEPQIESVRVPLLPRTQLAAAFAGAGYLRLPAQLSTVVFSDTLWSAYWLKNHPLAAAFAHTREWNLWYGWSHH